MPEDKTLLCNKLSLSSVNVIKDHSLYSNMPYIIVPGNNKNKNAKRIFSYHLRSNRIMPENVFRILIRKKTCNWQRAKNVIRASQKLMQHFLFTIPSVSMIILSRMYSKSVVCIPAKQQEIFDISMEILQSSQSLQGLVMGFVSYNAQSTRSVNDQKRSRFLFW
jgi:hypothetical protein